MTALQIEPDSLKERRDPVDAIATPLDGLDLVVETLNEPTGNPMIEIVQNVAPIATKRFDKSIVATNRTQPDLVAPSMNRLFCLSNGVGPVEDGGHLFSECVGLMEQR